MIPRFENIDTSDGTLSHSEGSSGSVYESISLSSAFSPAFPSTPTIISPISGVGAPCVGQVFVSDAAAYDFYRNYASFNGFLIRQKKISKTRISFENSDLWRVFVCHRAGTPVQDNRSNHGHGNSISLRCRCRARMVVKKDVGSSNASPWIVMHVSNIHNHELINQERLVSLPRLTEDDKNRITVLFKAGLEMKDILQYLQSEKGIGFYDLPLLERDVRSFMGTVTFFNANNNSQNITERQVHALQLIASDIILEFRNRKVGLKFLWDEMMKIKDQAREPRACDGGIPNPAHGSSGSTETGEHRNDRDPKFIIPLQSIMVNETPFETPNGIMKPGKKPRYCKVPSCGKLGHDSRNCPLRKASSAVCPQSSQIFSVPPVSVYSLTRDIQVTEGSPKKLRYCKTPNCGQSGHDSRNCPLKRVHESINFLQSSFSNGSSGAGGSSKKPRYCKVPNCGGKGHDSRNCPLRDDKLFN